MVMNFFDQFLTASSSLEEPIHSSFIIHQGHTQGHTHQAEGHKHYLPPQKKLHHLPWDDSTATARRNTWARRHSSVENREGATVSSLT